MKRWIAGLGVAAGLWVTGCARGPESTDEFPDAQAVLESAHHAFAAGNRDEALRILRESVASGLYPEDRLALFQSLLQALLRDGCVEEAQAEFAATVGRDEPLTRASFGTVLAHLEHDGDDPGVVAWALRLLDLDLPSDLAARAVSSAIGAALRSGEWEGAEAAMRAGLERFRSAELRRALENLTSAELRSGRLENARRMMDGIASAAGDDPELLGAVRGWRVELAFREDELPSAESAFRAAAPELPDRVLRELLYRATLLSAERGAWDTAERLCEFALSEIADRPQAVRMAASQWLSLARQQGLAEEIPRRLQALFEFGVGTETVFGLYRRDFYSLMNERDKALIPEMLAVSRRLSDGIAGSRDRAALQTMDLDAAFLLEDYERSIAILEEGIPGYDGAWHAMALNKLRAHLAVREGRTDEAVKRFRDFMDHVRTWEEPEVDPSTGMLFTKEMSLGHNARRIADLLAEAGREAEAAEAYAEARAYLEKALMEVSERPGERAFVEKEMSALP